MAFLWQNTGHTDGMLRHSPSSWEVLSSLQFFLYKVELFPNIDYFNEYEISISAIARKEHLIMSKKYSRPTKPTTRSVLIDLSELREIAGVGFDQEGRISAISPDGKPIPAKNITLERSFETGKSHKPKKILSRTKINEKSSFDHIDIHLLKYDKLIFVDTNDKEIDGKSVAVTAVISGLPPYQGKDGRINIELKTEFCFEFHDPQVHPEHIGWLYAIKCLCLGNLKNKENCVALVVDHDLGDMDKLNNREKLIAGVMYLPIEFQIIYACADRGQDQFINKAMGLCDWASNRMFALIGSNKDYKSGLQHAPLGEPFRYFRIWRPSEHQPHKDIGKIKQSMSFHIVGSKKV